MGAKKVIGACITVCCNTTGRPATTSTAVRCAFVSIANAVYIGTNRWHYQ